MNAELTFSEGECKIDLDDKDIAAAVASMVKSSGASESLVVAQILRWFVKNDTRLGSLIQYSIDVCADETIGEEFYKKDPTFLPFLSVCGTTNEDVHFINYVRSHKDAFVCKRPGCTGTLFGECPIMECEECGKQHYIKIDSITTNTCRNCVSLGLNTCNCESKCNEEGPDRMTTIYMI